MPTIRPSRDDDIDAITRIYAHHVLHGTGTFEVDPPSVQDMRARRAEVLARGLPWLVAESDNQVSGFAYCNWFKPNGQGLGRALLAELATQAERAGVRKLIAVIGDSGNTGSIGVHRALGFQHVGVLASCGWKFDRWLDVVLMERSLGLGDTTSPQ
ncbi:MAG: N-acetyltransferase [Comamonadaceae bacterium]|nr:N-acetyltransferase [Comamonadaceae bacterium]